MVIDAHMHLWDRVEGDIGEPVRSLGNGMIAIGDREMLGMPPYLLDGRATSEVFMSLMDAAGVDAAVVTQEYLDGNQNAYLARIKEKYPNRFFVHGLLEFRKPDRLTDEFQEVVDKYGFKGIKLPAGYLSGTEPRIFLTDSRLMHVFEQMEELHMILSVDLDCGETQVEEMREVSRSFPELTIVLGHFAMANRDGWLKQLHLAGEPNIYVESGGITWLFRTEGPPFPEAQEAFRKAAELVCVDKLMWGSDFPRTMVDFTYEQTLDFLRDGCHFFSDNQKAAILGGTAMDLFGFKESSKKSTPPEKITELD
ncbi:amidohydrolase family protein [Candidatus Latescibacterota bacterium]